MTPATSLPLFAESPVCRSGANCATCRDYLGGEAWRWEQFHRHIVPDGVSIWPCPDGKPWTNTGGIIPPVVKVIGVGGASSPATESQQVTGFDGSALWALLHAAPAATQDVVDAVTAGLSCGPCRTGWLAMLERTPPPLGDLPAFRIWAWQRHEEVNAKISKPLMTYDQAAARWGWET